MWVFERLLITLENIRYTSLNSINFKVMMVFVLVFLVFVPFTLNMFPVFATLADGLMTKPNTDIYVSKEVYPTIGSYNTTFGAQTDSYYDSFRVGKVNPADGSLINWYWGKDRLTGNYDVTTGKVTFKAPVYRDLISEPTYLTFEGYFYKYTQPSTFDPINSTTEFNFIDGIWNSSDDSGGWHSFVVYIKSK